MDIRPFDGNQASATELTDFHQLTLASAPDWANNAPTDYDSVIKKLRGGESPFGPTTHRAAYLDGKLIGDAEVSLPQEGSTQLAVLRITVHPDYRGRGVGTALLRHVAAECQALGRSVAEMWNLPLGGVGERWGRQRGFAVVTTRVNQTLA
ncbi:MAG TPA: GNAT family N-acetyltransferase, partial [Pseudonocardiaceae bacterium]|nr:GNAT family N-acetyltransferase [Pseudonocardiaceae bacterium]